MTTRCPSSRASARPRRTKAIPLPCHAGSTAMGASASAGWVTPPPRTVNRVKKDMPDDFRALERDQAELANEREAEAQPLDQP